MGDGQRCRNSGVGVGIEIQLSFVRYAVEG